MLKVTVDTENAAFDGEDGLRDEAARILRRIAAEIENGRATGKFQTVFDINGNDVGRWKLSREGRE